MKRIKAACICQTVHFLLKEDIAHDLAVRQVQDEVAQYKRTLERNRTQHKIIEETTQPDGSVIIKIIKQYNQSRSGIIWTDAKPGGAQAPPGFLSGNIRFAGIDRDRLRGIVPCNAYAQHKAQVAQLKIVIAFNAIGFADQRRLVHIYIRRGADRGPVHHLPAAQARHRPAGIRPRSASLFSHSRPSSRGTPPVCREMPLPDRAV